jgi:hypothetical protein
MYLVMKPGIRRVTRLDIFTLDEDEAGIGNN